MTTRALVVLETFELGGAERQAIHLAARWLQGAGDVTVMAWGPPGAASRLCDDRSIRWRSLGDAPAVGSRVQVARSAFRTASALRGADVVLSYTSIPNVLCALGRRLHRVPVVWGQRDAGVRTLPLMRTAARQADAWIANSPGGRDYLAGLGVARSTVDVVPNLLDPAPSVDDRAAWRRRLGVPDDGLVVVMLANLHEGKDHLTLVKAWAALPAATRARGTLVLAGRDDGTRAAIEDAAQRLGIREGLRFPGVVRDVTGLLGSADLVAHSSRTEGMPNAVIEAMAAGLAVVGTDIPPLRACLGDQDDALAAERDAPGLSRAMQRMLADDDRRRTAGELNRQRAAPWQSPERTVDRVIERARAVSGRARRA